MDVGARFPARNLPLLRDADVAVVGGSIAGVVAALQLARRGRRVALVESRTYLGWDITATLRPWLPASPGRGPFWDEVLQRLEIPAGTGEIPLPMDGLKLVLEDLLLEEGVGLLYASTAVGVLPGTGIVIGNKSGRQVVGAETVVDATETALVARLAGAEFGEGSPAPYLRTLEFDGVRGTIEGSLPVPRELGIAQSRVQTHRGYCGPEHVFVELCLQHSFEDGPDGFMRREIAGRHAGMALAAYLIGAEPAFGEAVLGSASYEFFGPQAPPLLDGRQVGSIPGLWPLPNASRPGLQIDPHAVARSGAELAERVLASALPRPIEEGTCAEAAPAGDWDELPRIAEPESPQRGRAYSPVWVPSQPVSLLRRCDVLVAGGGTSGATAAITSAQEGLSTVVLEMNPGLGGTGTLGGVNSYWYGRHVGFSARVERRAGEEQKKLRYSRGNWNIESKMYALLSDAERAGAQVYFRCVTVGTLMEGSRVCGAVAATPWGPVAVRAAVTIDATGDADLAAFAGAPAVYGAERDHTVMWFSLGQFTTPGRTRNNFTSMCDVTNVEDYTRAILAGRRRGSTVHDHGVYLAPRETRHIVGEAVMTHTDQLRRRHWPDTVTVHYSNHDVKGVSTSPWVRMGLIPPNLEIEIPYRMLLPRGVDGVIVAGKAISATHDALPAIRMQADLENLGGVAALAAAEAVRSGREPRHIDIPALQERLRREGVLPDHLPASPDRETPGHLRSLVEAIDGARALYDYSDMEMGEIFEGTIPMVEVCTAGREIVPLLEEALRSARGLRRVHLAQALAMYGERSCVPVLIEEIEHSLRGDHLPVRDNAIRHAGYPPDQGAMPDTVYLLYSLGMARDVRAIPIWERVAALLAPTEEGIRNRRQGIFYYVEALAWSAEELGDPAAIPMLRRLHSFPVLRDQVCRAGFQPDFFEERQAMLELMLARALARCGANEGIEILIDYLDDVRALLAEGAHDHLVALTGMDWGKDRGAWRSVTCMNALQR